MTDSDTKMRCTTMTCKCGHDSEQHNGFSGRPSCEVRGCLCGRFELFEPAPVAQAAEPTCEMIDLFTGETMGWIHAPVPVAASEPPAPVAQAGEPEVVCNYCGLTRSEHDTVLAPASSEPPCEECGCPIAQLGDGTWRSTRAYDPTPGLCRRDSEGHIQGHAPASEIPVVSDRMQGVDCPDCEDGTPHTHRIPSDSPVAASEPPVKHDWGAVYSGNSSGAKDASMEVSRLACKKCGGLQEECICEVAASEPEKPPIPDDLKEIYEGYSARGRFIDQLSVSAVKGTIRRLIERIGKAESQVAELTAEGDRLQDNNKLLTFAPQEMIQRVRQSLIDRLKGHEVAGDIIIMQTVDKIVDAELTSLREQLEAMRVSRDADLKKARIDALDDAAKAECLFCRDGDAWNGERHELDGKRYPCGAEGIRNLTLARVEGK